MKESNLDAQTDHLLFFFFHNEFCKQVPAVT